MADLDLEDIKKKKINISIENLVLLGAGMVSLIGMWFALQNDITEAKALPEPPVSRTEYDLKDQAIRTSILSTEKNPVVAMRAKKIKVPVVQGVSDKVLALKDLAKKNNFHLENILYVGNDLNDYLVMKVCGYTACPVDSHEEIKKISKYILTTKGGSGVVRELLEEVLGLDFIKILYKGLN